MDEIESKTPPCGAPLGAEYAPAAPQVEYNQSGGLVARLVGPCDLFLPVGLSLHAGPQPSGGGLHVHQAAMSKPMGLYWQGNGRLTLAGGGRHADPTSRERARAAREDQQHLRRLFRTADHPCNRALDAHDVGVDT